MSATRQITGHAQGDACFYIGTSHSWGRSYATTPNIRDLELSRIRCLYVLSSDGLGSVSLASDVDELAGWLNLIEEKP